MQALQRIGELADIGSFVALLASRTPAVKLTKLEGGPRQTKQTFDVPPDDE